MAGTRRSIGIGRWLVAVALSAAVHLAIISPLLLRKPEIPPPEPPPVELTLERPRRDPPPPTQPDRPTPPTSGPSLAQPVSITQPSDQRVSAPSVAGPPGVAQGSPPPPPGGMTLGCLSDTARMTPERRKQCEQQKWGGLAVRAPGDNGRVPAPDMDPRKPVHYEEVIKGKTSDGHGPQFACMIPLGKGRKPKLPPNSLKLGPCIIRPPKGVLTPGVDVPDLDTPYVAPPVKLPQFPPQTGPDAPK